MTRVVAIDGPAAAGKGTLARRLAITLGLPHLDTGLLYRATGRRVLLAGRDPADPAAALVAAQALTPADLARPDLRGPEADRAAAAVAAQPAVRAALLAYQRQIAAGGAVLDGRDIGTVVVPDAAAKFYIVASLEARAGRRWHELGGDLAAVTAAMAARDQQDAERAAAPLRPADDAVTIDTSALTADQVYDLALAIVLSRTGFA